MHLAYVRDQAGHALAGARQWIPQEHIEDPVTSLATGLPLDLDCAQAVKQLTKDKRSWEVRSAGKGSKGERWYAWAWIGTASPHHHLLIRRHLKTGPLWPSAPSPPPSSKTAPTPRPHHLSTPTRPHPATPG